MNKKVLFAVFALLICFLVVSCDENQQLIINPTTPSPTIRGTVSIPDSADLSGSDFYIRVMEGEKAVYTGRVNSDGSFSVPGLSEEATYSILLTTEEPGDIKGTERDISRATTSGYGGWLSNVTASINEQAGVGSIKVKPLGTIKGVVKKDGAEDNYDTTVYIPGTSYLSMTDGEGNFSLFNVPQATYTLRYISNGYMAKMVENVVLYSDSDTENPVSTVPEQTLIKNAGILMGTIIKNGATDYSGITVMLSDGTNTYTGGTTKDGDLLLSGILPSTYTATVSSTGFLTQTVDNIRIDAARTTSIAPISLVANGGDIKGSVSMNDDGEKAGVLVTAKSSDDKYSYTTSTDNEGKFTINNAYPGTYILTLTKSGYTSVNLDEIPAKAGQTTNLGSILLDSRFGSVSGRVALADSADNSGVTVTLTFTADPTIAPTAVSGADGTYTFSNLANAGQYSVTFSKDGYVSSTGTVVTVTLGQNQAIDDVTLRSLASKVSGTATLAETQDYTGISILLKATDNSIQYDTTTDQQGSYVMARVKPGEYTLTVSKAGYVSKTVEEIIVESSTEKTLDAVSLLIGTRSVTGKITLELADSHEGTLITATNTEDVTKIYTAITNTSGEFTLAGMAPGKYNLALSHSNYVTSTLSIDVLDGTLATINDSELAIARGKIQGYVTLEGYTDYSGTTVSLVGTTYSTATDEEGFYQFSVPTGNYSGGIRFEHEDFESYMHAATVTVQMNGAYGIPTVSLDARNISVVKGVFTLKNMADSSGITVYLEDLPQYAAETDSEGNWIIRHVPIGQHTLVTYRENVKAFSMEINLTPSPEFDNGELILIPEAATIQGFARLDGMSSFGGITITAVPTEAWETLTTTTKADGSYYLSNLISTFDYTVSFSKDGWKTESNVQSDFSELEVRTLDDVVLSDITAPVISSVVINNGGGATSDREIKIYLTATDEGIGCSKVQINTENRFDETVTYRNYLTEQDYVLPEGNGEKTIYIKVYDKAGNASEVVSKTITLTEQRTVVGGVLVGETDFVWTKEKSPYYVESNILIEEGRTLTVEAGTVIEFGGPYYIDVEGLLYVNGTDDDMVYMYGVGEGENTWKGLAFGRNALSLSGSDGNHGYTSGSVLRYVYIQNCEKGVSGYVYLENCTIEAFDYALGDDSNPFRGMIRNSSIDGKVLHYASKMYGNSIDASELSGISEIGQSFLYENTISGNSLSYVYGSGNEFSVNDSSNIGNISNSIFNGGLVSIDNKSFINNVTFVDCSLQISGGEIINSILSDCSFVSFAASKMSFCNLIDCGSLTTTTDHNSVAEYDMRYNFWGYDKTAELNEKGYDSNLSFITDYYDDFSKTKILFSDWSQIPFDFAGYKSDNYMSYSITPILPESPTLRVDSDYTVHVLDSNKASVDLNYGKEAVAYRVFQDGINASTFNNSDWINLSSNQIEFSYDPLSGNNLFDWYIQFKDNNDTVSGIYMFSVYRNVLGPTGGLIFYDKGIHSEGWRYLETAPGDLKQKDGVPEINDDDIPGTFFFGLYQLDENEAALFVNGTPNYNNQNCTGTGVGMGKRNTSLLVNAMNNRAYLGGGSWTDLYAAIMCDILEFSVDEVIYDDWFLPSKDELYMVYSVLYLNGWGGLNGYYWSSSECGEYKYYDRTNRGWMIDFTTGINYEFDRDFPVKVRPIRAF